MSILLVKGGYLKGVNMFYGIGSLLGQATFEDFDKAPLIQRKPYRTERDKNFILTSIV